MWLAHTLHLLGVAYFVGFLLIDALIVRRFLNSECHNKKLLFYERAKYSLYLFVAIILVSGFWILSSLDFNPPMHIWIKITLATAAIALFFASPYIVKKIGKRSVDYVYGVVLMWAVLVIILAKI